MPSFLRINHTIILDDPFDDPDGLQIPEKSPEPTEKQLQVTIARNSIKPFFLTKMNVRL